MTPLAVARFTMPPRLAIPRVLAACRLSFGAALIATLVLVCGSALAAGDANKDEAVAMVKKAVAYIKSEGPKTAYPAIDNREGLRASAVFRAAARAASG